MSRIHHFEITSHNLLRTLTTFVSKLGFRVFAHEADTNGTAPVAFAVTLNSIIIVLRDVNQYPNHRGSHCLPLSDWVSDLALVLEQQEFEKISEKIRNKENGKTKESRIAPPSSSSCDNCYDSLTFESPFPHVRHTILTDSNCNCSILLSNSNSSCTSSCECLPAGLSVCPLLMGDGGHCSVCVEIPSEQLPAAQPILDCIDHVTFACDISTSNEIVKWYSDYLGFRQVSFVNTHDDQGFVMEGDNGIYLSAMEYGAMVSEDGSTPEAPLIQLILAEPLNESGASNQVQTFITSNGGPGVQHIAFHTSNITRSVSVLMNNGLSFIKPPPQYYSMMKESNSVILTGEDLDLLESNHVLIDVETHRNIDSSIPIQYLLQVFSHSLFDKDTFFIELITRYGAAKGFGAGNISALWKALDIHLKSKLT